MWSFLMLQLKMAPNMSVNNHSRRVSVVEATRKLQENKDNSPTHDPEQKFFRTQGGK